MGDNIAQTSDAGDEPREGSLQDQILNLIDEDTPQRTETAAGDDERETVTPAEGGDDERETVTPAEGGDEERETVTPAEGGDEERETVTPAEGGDEETERLPTETDRSGDAGMEQEVRDQQDESRLPPALQGEALDPAEMRRDVRPVERDSAAEVDETSIEHILSKGDEYQREVNELANTLDAAGRFIRELDAGNPTAEQRDARLVRATEAFKTATEMVTPEEQQLYREQHRLVLERIQQEEARGEQADIEMLRRLKKVERNLNVLKKAPVFTRGNAALAMYRAGKVRPYTDAQGQVHEPIAKQWLRHAMLADREMNANDPTYKSIVDEDENFHRRRIEIESRYGVNISADMLAIQRDILTAGGEQRQPPAEDGEQRQPPAEDGEQRQPPAEDGEQRQPPAEDGEQRQPPAEDGEQRQPPADGGEEAEGGERTVVTAPQDRFQERNEFPQENHSPARYGKTPFGNIAYATTFFRGAQDQQAYADALAREIELPGATETDPPVKMTVEQLIQQSIADADAGTSPRLAQLQTEVNESYIALGNQARQPFGPEGNQAAWGDVKTALDRSAEELLGQAALSDDQKAQVAAMITRLDQSTSPEEYARNQEQFKPENISDNQLKLFITSDAFKTYLARHENILEPVLPLRNQYKTATDSLKLEMNQRAMSRRIYGELLKNAGRTDDAATQFTEAYAFNHFPDMAGEFSEVAINAGVKPADLLAGAVAQHEAMARGEQSIGLPISKLSGEAARLFELRLGSDPSEEDKAAALAEFEPHVKKLVELSDTGYLVEEQNSQGWTRFAHAQILQMAGDDRAKQTFIEAYVTNMDPEIADDIAEEAIKAGVKPAELLTAAIGQYEKAKTSDTAVPGLSSSVLLLETRRFLEQSQGADRGELRQDLEPVLERLNQIVDGEHAPHAALREAAEAEFTALLPEEAEKATEVRAALNAVLESPLMGQVNQTTGQDPLKQALSQLLRADVSAEDKAAIRSNIRNSQFYGRKYQVEGTEELDFVDHLDRLVNLAGGEQNALKLLEAQSRLNFTTANENASNIHRAEVRALRASLLALTDKPEEAQTMLDSALEVVPEARREEFENDAFVGAIKQSIGGDNYALEARSMSEQERADLDVVQAPLDQLSNTQIRQRIMLLGSIENESGERVRDVPTIKQNFDKIKASYEELIRRADNAIDPNTGEKYDFEAIYEGVRTSQKYLAGSEVDNIAPNTHPETGQQMTLAERMTLQESSIQALQFATNRVRLRMELATLMGGEDLEQRALATQLYQDARTLMKEMPQDLIEDQSRLLSNDLAAYGAGEAGTRLRQLTTVMDGVGGTTDQVIADPAYIGVANLEAALYKQAAFYFLAPKEEVKDGQVIFTFGNHDGFNPELGMEFLFDAMAAKDIDPTTDRNWGNKDREITNLHAWLSKNAPEHIRDQMKKQQGFESAASTLVAGVVTYGVLAATAGRGKARPGAMRTSMRVAGALTVATATRAGTMRALTGEWEPLQDSVVHGASATLLAAIGRAMTPGAASASLADDAVRTNTQRVPEGTMGRLTSLTTAASEYLAGVAKPFRRFTYDEQMGFLHRMGIKNTDDLATALGRETPMGEMLANRGAGRPLLVDGKANPALRNLFTEAGIGGHALAPIAGRISKAFGNARSLDDAVARGRFSNQALWVEQLEAQSGYRTVSQLNSHYRSLNSGVGKLVESVKDIPGHTRLTAEMIDDATVSTMRGMSDMAGGTVATREQVLKVLQSEGVQTVDDLARAAADSTFDPNKLFPGLRNVNGNLRLSNVTSQATFGFKGGDGYARVLSKFSEADQILIEQGRRQAASTVSSVSTTQGIFSRGFQTARSQGVGAGTRQVAGDLTTAATTRIGNAASGTYRFFTESIPAGARNSVTWTRESLLPALRNPAQTGRALLETRPARFIGDNFVRMGEINPAKADLLHVSRRQFGYAFHRNVALIGTHKMVSGTYDRMQHINEDTGQRYTFGEAFTAQMAGQPSTLLEAAGGAWLWTRVGALNTPIWGRYGTSGTAGKLFQSTPLHPRSWNQLSYYTQNPASALHVLHGAPVLGGAMVEPMISEGIKSNKWFTHGPTYEVKWNNYNAPPTDARIDVAPEQSSADALSTIVLDGTERIRDIVGGSEEEGGQPAGVEERTDDQQPAERVNETDQSGVKPPGSE